MPFLVGTDAAPANAVELSPSLVLKIIVSTMTLFVIFY